MTIEQYIRDNSPNELASEFTITVDTFELSSEGTILQGHITPNDGGQVVEWIAFDDKIMILPTDEELEAMPKPNVDWDKMWRKIQAKLKIQQN